MCTSILWAVVQDKPMVYEQEDVLDALHGLVQKTIIPLNPQIEIDKPEIWQHFSIFGGLYVTKRLTKIIYGIWTKIVHNLSGSLDNIKGNTQWAE